ncbi:HupE/UreJ family protein [Cohnella nanjingensis]|uniref:HupE/UreJ family protein n=1 Tax=Cohnella nanjingensis TaxID=1387779 RepID=A0A7X0RKH7_9BACL|nr:HupE/UreJ family protein [Cohnella nanjingensis]MBB6669110.1 HupE/UreJ family protein [Cohnella nanjingensis]
MAQPFRLSFRSCFLLAAVLAFVLLPFNRSASAHAYSAAYNTLTLTKTQSVMTYALDELSAIELAGGDANGDHMLDADEFNAIKDKLADLIQQHIVFQVGGETRPWISLERFDLVREGDASKVVLKAIYPQAAAFQSVSLRDDLYRNDPQTNYVDLLTIQYGAQTSTSALSGKERLWVMQLTDADYASLPEDANPAAGPVASAGLDEPSADGSSTSSDALSGWLSFFKLGIHHILGGYDHLLFLFSLLIARQTFKQYAAMITAFTLAHSLTLTLTVLGVIDVSPRFVEPAIALSICYVALDNILRPNVSYRWVLTFAFGLIHGMGFADILKGMEIPRSQLVVDLTSFNLGIETVQLAIVGVLIPLLYWLHRYRHARRFVVAGSGAALLLGGAWLFERLFLA